MVSLCILILVVAGALAQPEAKPGSCSPVECTNPFPCIGGRVVSNGCCVVCKKDKSNDKTILPVTECPPGICATVSCGGRLGDCSGENEYIKHGGGLCGCCSTCITLVDVGGDCTKFDTECKKGSTCNPRTGRCEPIAISPVTECPPGICATVSCGGNLRQCSGPNKYIKHGDGLCGCCSTCIYLVDVGGDCTKFDTECKKGSTCNPRTHRCELVDSNCLRPDVCRMTKCGVRVGECRGFNEYIKEGAGYCGCCNACVTLINNGGDCSGRLTECRSGTQCNPLTKVCE